MTANQLKYQELQETVRANQAKEAELHRANLAKEAQVEKQRKQDLGLGIAKTVAGFIPGLSFRKTL